MGAHPDSVTVFFFMAYIQTKKTLTNLCITEFGLDDSGYSDRYQDCKVTLSITDLACTNIHLEACSASSKRMIDLPCATGIKITFTGNVEREHLIEALKTWLHELQSNSNG